MITLPNITAVKRKPCAALDRPLAHNHTALPLFGFVR